MPDHFHCIWELPDGDADYSKRISIIKRKVSQRTRLYLPDSYNESRAKRKELNLWQRRFWEHEIRDEKDLEAHVSYIHFNPVKHGYVSAVKEWPYSSFHRFVESGDCDIDWGGDFRKPGSLSYGE